jgi:hypothetical protein
MGKVERWHNLILLKQATAACYLDSPYVWKAKTYSSAIMYVSKKLQTELKMAAVGGKVFSEYFGFPCQPSFHKILHHHNHPGQV